MLALLDLTHFVSSSGYAAIFVLSVLQSCCVPTSSEITLGFAGVLAAEGKLSLPGVIVAGAAGELVGAYIAWMIGRFGGRAFVDRYGRYVLMTPRDLDRAEAWYGRHERWGVFGSRLLPVIRNFVALPAGVAEVPLLRFGVLTGLGSLIWDGAMALIGYGVGGSWKSVMKGFSDAGYLLGVLAVAAIAFVLWHRWRSYREHASDGPGAAPDEGYRPAHRARRPGPAAGAGVQVAAAAPAGTDALRQRVPSPGPGASGGAAAGAGRGLRGYRPRRAPALSLKVPVRITAVFWAIKLLSTAMGEALSDSLVFGINKYLAVLLGFLAFLFAMRLQLRARRYNPWRYWFAVAMVAVFGTMAADVLHVVLHIPYLASSLFYLVVLAVVLYLWKRVEGTISIHSIFTLRREVFYWLTVLATFALGTAVGDLTATTFKLGFLGSGVMFAVLFALPGLAYRFLGTDPVLSFWAAYVLTRPLGASFADWIGFPRSFGHGLGLGHPLTFVVFALPIIALVWYVAASRIDMPAPPARLRSRAGGGRAASGTASPARAGARPPSPAPAGASASAADRVSSAGTASPSPFASGSAGARLAPAGSRAGRTFSPGAPAHTAGAPAAPRAGRYPSPGSPPADGRPPGRRAERPAGPPAPARSSRPVADIPVRQPVVVPRSLPRRPGPPATVDRSGTHDPEGPTATPQPPPPLPPPVPGRSD